jgi:hypothetical protein
MLHAGNVPMARVLQRSRIGRLEAVPRRRREIRGQFWIFRDRDAKGGTISGKMGLSWKDEERGNGGDISGDCGTVLVETGPTLRFGDRDRSERAAEEKVTSSHGETDPTG